jgi:hypothetical protein
MSNSRRVRLRANRWDQGGRADLKHPRAMTEAEIRMSAPLKLANRPRDFWEEAKLVEPAARRSRKG